jgi:CBS-domain-containing membrane protein
MNIIDPKVKGQEKQYLFQSGLATLTILLVLLFLDVIQHTAIIATLGASAFIIFIMPKSYISMPRQVIFGYLIGIIAGCVCHFSALALSALPFITDKVAMILFGALAVGITIFILAITDTEHPPVVGVALGLVLNQWNYQTIIFIICAVGIMTVIKILLEPILIDLM